MKFFCNDIAFFKRLMIVILVAVIIILLITARCSTFRVRMFW